MESLQRRLTPSKTKTLPRTDHYVELKDEMADQGMSTTSDVKDSVSKGSEKWDAMSEEQKQTTFASIPSEQKKGKTYYEWITEGYHHQYENWMPWIEDQYLKWFTKDNKASYATKEQLDKSKITGIEQVSTLQDGAHGLFAGQVGKGGMLQPLGDQVSKEGVNRAERAGKGDGGTYGVGPGELTNGLVSSAKGAGSSVWGGAKSTGGYVGSMFGQGEDRGRKK